MTDLKKIARSIVVHLRIYALTASKRLKGDIFPKFPTMQMMYGSITVLPSASVPSIASLDVNLTFPVYLFLHLILKSFLKLMFHHLWLVGFMDNSVLLRHIASIF